VMTNVQALPVPQLEDTEIYGSANGFTIWDVGTNCCQQVYTTAPWTIKKTRIWGNGRRGLYGYAMAFVTIDDWVQIGDPHPWFWSPYVNNLGLYFGDYLVRNVVMTNLNIQGLRVGVQVPSKPGDVTDIFGDVATPIVIRDSYLRNQFNVGISPMYGVTGGDGLLPPRLTQVNNVRFDTLPANVTLPEGPQWVPCHLCMSFNVDPRNANIIKEDKVFVTDYNGVTGDNFQLFYQEQAPTYVVPQSADGLTGAPVAGLTNAQLWAQYHLAIAGSVAPCSTTRPLVQGFTCGATSSAPAPPGTAVVTP